MELHLHHCPHCKEKFPCTNEEFGQYNCNNPICKVCWDAIIEEDDNV